MIHVLHLITCLDRGGTETMLARLVAGMDRSRFRNTVVSLTGPGPLPCSRFKFPVRLKNFPVPMFREFEQKDVR